MSGLDKVKTPLLMVQQLRTYRKLAFAPFADLVRRVDDPAILVYLDAPRARARNRMRTTDASCSSCSRSALATTAKTT